MRDVESTTAADIAARSPDAGRLHNTLRGGVRHPRPELGATDRGGDPTPSPSATGVRWEEITTVLGADPAGDWRLLGGFNGGYVALQRTPPAAWFSPDGRSWTRTALGVPEGVAVTAAAIASNGASILIGGEYIPCTERQYTDDPFHACRPRPVTWISSDGLEWQTSAPWTGPNGEEGRSGSSFLTLWSVPTGGWDAGQMFNRSENWTTFRPWGRRSGIRPTASAGPP